MVYQNESPNLPLEQKHHPPIHTKLREKDKYSPEAWRMKSCMKQITLQSRSGLTPQPLLLRINSRIRI